MAEMGARLHWQRLLKLLLPLLIVDPGFRSGSCPSDLHVHTTRIARLGNHPRSQVKYAKFTEDASGDWATVKQNPVLGSACQCLHRPLMRCLEDNGGTDTDTKRAVWGTWLRTRATKKDEQRREGVNENACFSDEMEAFPDNG